MNISDSFTLFLISIFLSTLKIACDMIFIHKDASKCLLDLFINKPAATALHSHITLSSQFHRRRKERKLTSYWAKVFPLLRPYSTDNVITNMYAKPFPLHSCRLWCQMGKWKAFGVVLLAVITFIMVISVKQYSLRGYMDRSDIACTHSDGKEKCYVPWPCMSGNILD